MSESEMKAFMYLRVNRNEPASERQQTAQRERIECKTKGLEMTMVKEFVEADATQCQFRPMTVTQEG